MRVPAKCCWWGVLYWAAIGLVLMSCFDSAAQFWGNPECLLGWLTFSGGILYGVWIAISKIWTRTVYKIGNFKLSFISHLPQEEYGEAPVEDPPFSIKLLPLGAQTLYVRVIAQHGFPVKHINLRFLNRDVSNAKGTIIEVTDANDPYYGLNRQRDGNFGIEGEYQNVRVLAKGQGLYFEMNITAHQPWTGLLSFRAQDVEGFRSYARCSVETRSDVDSTPSPPRYAVASSANTVGITPVIRKA